ncbi:MAG: hypothetical protein ACO3S5_06290 [Ilumatobacteraceae bacterium]
MLLTLLQSQGSTPPEPPQDDPGSGSRTYVGIAGNPRRRTVDEELEAILASLLLLT